MIWRWCWEANAIPLQIVDNDMRTLKRDIFFDFPRVINLECFQHNFLSSCEVVPPVFNMFTKGDRSCHLENQGQSYLCIWVVYGTTYNYNGTSKRHVSWWDWIGCSKHTIKMIVVFHLLDQWVYEDITKLYHLF